MSDRRRSTRGQDAEKSARRSRLPSASAEQEDEEKEENEEEEDDEFMPSDQDEEEEAPTPVSRRRSAPTRQSTAASSSSGSRPTRSKSAAAAAPTSQSQSKGRGAGVGSKRKKRVASSSEEEEEDEEEEEEEETDQSDGSSSDEDEAQSSSLRKRSAKCGDKSAKGASASCGRGGGGSRRRSKSKGEADDDDPARSGERMGGESLLAHFNRLRSLYEAPQGCFDEMFDQHADADAADGPAPSKRAKSNSAAAAAAASAASSSSAAAAAAASASSASGSGPASKALVDFTNRVPQEVAQHVFEYLNPVTVARCERVCRRWKVVVQSETCGGVYKALFGQFFPLLRRSREAHLRRQESDVDPASLRARDQTAFFEQPNPEGMTVWAARRTEGRAVPVFEPHANAPLGVPLPAAAASAARATDTASVEQLLQPSRGRFHWKHSLINRLAATCVECRAPTLDVYKLTCTRVCITCAMRHPDGRYDVVNSGCAKGKSLLTDRELAVLPSVTEFDHHDDHKTIFYMQAMVHGLRNRKFGGPDAFQRVWAQRVLEAQQRLAQRKEAGLTKKKLIPVVYRDNVGSTPQKTKGFFLCGRHNLATLFDKSVPPR